LFGLRFRKGVNDIAIANSAIAQDMHALGFAPHIWVLFEASKPEFWLQNGDFSAQNAIAGTKQVVSRAPHLLKSNVDDTNMHRSTTD